MIPVVMPRATHIDRWINRAVQGVIDLEFGEQQRSQIGIRVTTAQRPVDPPLDDTILR